MGISSLLRSGNANVSTTYGDDDCGLLLIAVVVEFAVEIGK
jgi:hypothetical protein